MAEWWNRNKIIPLENGNFQKIIDFYLFNCPSEIKNVNEKKGTVTYEKVSQKAVTLREKEWKDGGIQSLLAAMKKTNSKHLCYENCKKGQVLEKQNMLENEKDKNDSFFEMIVFQTRGDMNDTSSIYYYIRNALAHGSFSVVEHNNKTTYFFESAKNDTITARIRLREETLLNWIVLFNSTADDLRKSNKRANNKKYRDKKKKSRVEAA